MNGVQPFLYIEVNETNEENEENCEQADDPLALTEDDLNDFEENGISIRNTEGALCFRNEDTYDTTHSKNSQVYIEISDEEDTLKESSCCDESLHSSTEEGNASSTETMSSEEMNDSMGTLDKSNRFSKQEDGYVCNSCDFWTRSYKTVQEHVKLCHLRHLHPTIGEMDPLNAINFVNELKPGDVQVSHEYMSVNEAACTDYLLALSKQLEKQWFTCPFCPYYCNFKEQMAQHIANGHAAEIISHRYGLVNLKDSRQIFEGPNQDENIDSTLIDYQEVSGSTTVQSPDSNPRRTRAIPFDTIAKEHSILAKMLEERQQESQNRFTCELCDFKTGLRFSIINHFETHHGAKKVLSCGLCDYLTHSEYFLRRHTNAKHTDKKMYKCKSCDYSSSRRYTMRSHIDSVHKKIKPYPCGQCQYSAARKDALKTHVAAVHEGKRPFSCHECTFSSSRKYLLKNHVRSFHGPDSSEALEKMFTCGVCGLVAKSSQNLKDHLSQAHGGSTKSTMIPSIDGKSSYACDLCNFKCHRRTNLYSHRKAMHAGPESSRRHPCPFCFYFAYKLTGLKGHITKCHKDCSYSDIDRIINAR